MQQEDGTAIIDTIDDARMTLARLRLPDGKRR